MTNLNDITKSKQSLKLSWLVCLTAALFFFYEFVQMSMFNAISPYLLSDFSISAAQLGNLSAAYFYATILFMFPAGLLLDRFSTKKIIISAMIVCILGTIGFAYIENYYAAILCRFLTGIGGSFPFLSCLRLALRWFPAKKMALVTGVIVTIAMLGGMAAQTPLTLIVETLNWRNAILIDSLLGVLFLLSIMLIVSDRPKQQESNKTVNTTINRTINTSSTYQTLTNIGLWTAIKIIIRNKQNWLFGLYVCMLNLPVFLLAQTWGSLYLTQARSLSPTEASYVTSMIFLGTIVGSPLVGWWSDIIGRRKLPMSIGAILAIVSIFLIIFTQQLNLTQLLLLFFVLGLVTSTQIISYPMITESNPSTTVGGALGLASVLIMAGGAIFEPLFGWIMQQHWDGLLINHHPMFSSQSYLYALLILPAGFLIGLVANNLGKETYGRSLYPKN